MTSRRHALSVRSASFGCGSVKANAGPDTCQARFRNRRDTQLAMRIEVEQVEQVADGRHVARRMGVVAILLGIGQVVAAAVAERGVEHPVPFDELHEGGVLVIDVADVAAGGEGRNGDHRNARAGPEEIDRLNEARIVEAAALVHRDENGGLGRVKPKLVPPVPKRN